MDFNCYIDETGDEGIGVGGSRWFTVGAMVVPNHMELQCRRLVGDIRKRLGVDTLHWSKLKRHEQKRYVCQEMLKGDWEFCCVATDKNHANIMNAPNMKRKDQLYCYTVKLLFERLSWYARDHGGGKAIPVFEYRSSTSYEDMRDYIRRLSCWVPSDAVQISWANIEFKNFKMQRKDKCALLQACDCVVGTVREGLEYGSLGLVEPCYALSLKDRFYRRQGKLFGYGMKFLHLKPKDLSEVVKEYGWLEQL